MIGSYWGDAWTTLKTTAASAGESWSSSIEDLKAKAREFVTVFDKLKKMRSRAGLSSAEMSSIDSVLSRGELVRKTVASITGSIDSVSNMLPKNLLGGAVRSGSLGILPLIPVAVIAAAISAITGWLSYAYVEIDKLELAEKVRQDGGDPASVLDADKSVVSWQVAIPIGLLAMGLVYVMGRSNGR